MDEGDLSYGPVYVTEGPHQGRIGYYDDNNFEIDEEWWKEHEHLTDDEMESLGGAPGRTYAIVYFGDFLISPGSYDIPFDHLRPVTTDDLLNRKNELSDRCEIFWDAKYPEHALTDSEKLDLLYELHYVDAELVDRMISARYKETGEGEIVFISHSSHDKKFARWLCTDLKAAGYEPWLDEQEIAVGESIPERVASGIEQARFVVVVLSEHAVKSRWVEREWHAKYWQEVETGNIAVLPVLNEPCAVPTFLRPKKYADFSLSYNNGLDDLLVSLHKLTAKERNRP